MKIIISILNAKDETLFSSTEPLSIMDSVKIMDIFSKPSMFGNKNFIIKTSAMLDESIDN